MQILTVVLTSAVVSAAVTSIFTFIGQCLDRKSKRQELLFAKAVELAQIKTDFLVQLAKDTGQIPAIHDYVAYAEMYYWLLLKLRDDGRLPENWRDEVAKKFPLENAENRRY